MAIHHLSPNAEEFLNQLKEAVSGLLYPSESDIEITVHHFTKEQVGERLSTTDIKNLFFPEVESMDELDVDHAMMERTDMNGYTNFFRHYIDKITQYPSGEIIYWEPAHRDRAEKFRKVSALLLDNLLHQRWFKMNPNGSARKHIFVGGQLVDIQFNDETNELTPTLGDWFVLATVSVES
ncbi:MAG: hypothetical protein KGS48_19340 [Bacteroidetes bacterium]|nr:hypothetical protein [Bacteroidota bacterium]